MAVKKRVVNRKLVPLTDDEVAYIDAWLRKGKTIQELMRELMYGNYETFMAALARRGFMVGTCLISLPESGGKYRRISKANRTKTDDTSYMDDYGRALGRVLTNRKRPDMETVRYLLGVMFDVVEKYNNPQGVSLLRSKRRLGLEGRVEEETPTE